jgi:hypothetical protein
MNAEPVSGKGILSFRKYVVILFGLRVGMKTCFLK